MRMKYITKIFKAPLFWIFLYLLYALIMNILDLESCPIKYLIGLPCPGCGMTRSFICLFHFDFKGALHYNALFILLMLIAIVIILRKYSIFKKMYYSKVFWLSVGSIILLYYAYRMIYVYPNEPIDYYFFNLLNKIRGRI